MRLPIAMPFAFQSATLLLCIFFTHFNFATLSVHLSQKKLGLEDTLLLSIQSDTLNTQAPPDPQALANLSKNFDILNMQQSQFISIYNGVTQRTQKWQYRLHPKRSGRLTIPAFVLGSEHSAPSSIEVRQKKQQPNRFHSNNAPHVFIEINTHPKTPFVQSQVKYQVKLFYLDNISSGTLSDPKVDHALMITLEPERRYEENRYHHQYHVLEKNYVFFPEKSGSLSVSGPVFSGREQHLGSFLNDHDFFEPIAAPIKAYGDVKEFNVQPIPATLAKDVAEHWLAAENITLSESWQYPPHALKIGEPIQRTITIQALGISAAQLPPLVSTTSKAFNHYEAPTQTKTYTERNHSLAVTRTKTVTYLAKQSGSIALPAIHLTWWSTKKNRLEKTSLAEKILTVPKSLQSETQPVHSQAKETSKQHRHSLKDNTYTTSPAAAQQATLETLPRTRHNTKASAQLSTEGDGARTNIAKKKSILKQHLAAAFSHVTLLLEQAWLIGLLCLGILCGIIAKKILPRLILKWAKRKKQLAAIAHACHNNDPIEAEQSLLTWGQTIFPKAQIRSLSDLKNLIINPNLKYELQYLETIRYGLSHQWQGERLYYHLKKFKLTTRRQIQAPALAALYPEHTPTSHDFPFHHC